MSLVASDKGGADFKAVPAGTHVAICVMVVDLGNQLGSGKFKAKVQPKVYIRWELPNEQVEWKDRDGVSHNGPMIIGRTYTLSLSEKANLRADLEGWRGRTFTEQELQGFDLNNILGKPCMLGVTHNVVGNKTYANVSAVMGLPKGTTAPKATNKLVSYTPDDHNPQVFGTLPDWLQQAISERIVNDAKTIDHAGNQTPDFDDDIPF